ncbi:MAG: sulfatase-like hydrolase/transferase [Proteobacteria bacterium]|nr:sulfatase-like hydrolase/transferase [Pseudomonadota bacterium]
MPIKHKNFLYAWLALTLSCLFFYPLFATLHDNDIILQWRIQNSLELIAAIALFTLLLTGALWLIDKIPNIKLRFSALFLIFIIPFISFFVHFLQQLGFKGELINLGQYAHGNRFIVVIIGAFCCALFLFLIIRYPRKMTYALIIVLLALSPLNFLAGWTLWNSRHVNTKIVINAPDHYEKKVKTSKHSLIVILFDELSYEYLYKDGSINPQYVNFQQLSSKSDNYHAATSPGSATLTAIPGMLMGRRYENIAMKYDNIYRITKDNKEEYLKIEPDNLFAVAKNKGYKTFAYGTFLPYCEMFDQSLDGCRSFSVYNYATVETQFSLLNPIMTTLIIWPRQRPQGFIKNKAISPWQRRQTEQVFHLTLKTLDEKAPVFMFSHIYSTHLPFVFNRNGYYENKKPFLQNDENYTKGLEYADHLLGELINKMERNGIFEGSEIIILSDHNYRIMFPDKQSHIPLIIKNPYQKAKKDILEPAHAEQALREVIEKL